MYEKTMVIFDFDGVLVDSWWLTHKTSKKRYPGLTEDVHRKGFEGNIYESDKSWSHLTRIEIDYFVEYEKEMHLVRFFDVAAVVHALSEKHLLSIVSSTTTEVIKRYLIRENLLEYFSDVLGADIHESKHEKIKILFERHRLEPHQCVMVTDTVGDVREARKAGVDAIGVNWGFHEEERLKKVQTFKIVHKPSELVPAIEEYFSK